jgi:ribosomal protein S18 acetylase RimI-like enzyme
MVQIRRLTSLALSDLKQVAERFTSPGKFVAFYEEESGSCVIRLQYQQLAEPFEGSYDHFDDETVNRYVAGLQHGFSFGAYDQNELVGVLLAEPHDWNGSIWVWEFHVSATRRGRGVGRELMSALIAKARNANYRTIVCETQNTNAEAIKIYRRLGFRVEGIDISYYTNRDYPDGSIAVFMKHRL